jgi:hypothetical protein
MMALVPPMITPEKNRELKKDLNIIIKLSLKSIQLFMEGTHTNAISKANKATEVLTRISRLSSGAGLIIR